MFFSLSNLFFILHHRAQSTLGLPSSSLGWAHSWQGRGPSCCRRLVTKDCSTQYLTWRLGRERRPVGEPLYYCVSLCVSLCVSVCFTVSLCLSVYLCSVSVYVSLFSPPCNYCYFRYSPLNSVTEFTYFLIFILNSSLTFEFQD